MENINYWNAVGAAWNRMKGILFQPFNIEKWFLMGFAAWIAGLNTGGGGGGGGSSGFTPLDSHANNVGNSNFGTEFHHFWNEYSILIIMIGTIGIVIVLALGIAFAWLHARGRFIFLDNVLRNHAAIVEPWKKYKEQGNSLFFWNLAIGFIGLFFFLLTAAICVPLSLPMFAGNGSVGLGIAGIALAVLLLSVYGIVIAFIQMLVHDFITPFMLKYDLRIREAWRRFQAILKPAFGQFVIYGLVRFVVNIMISTALLMAYLLTCCCLAILAGIPYLGTVLLLPVFVFIRLIGIEFLKQFGENIDDVKEQTIDENLLDLP